MATVERISQEPPKKKNQNKKPFMWKKATEARLNVS